MNELCTSLSDWCNFNGLTLNPSKSKAIIFSNKTVTNPPAVFLNGSIIEYSNEICYLGLISNLIQN